MFITKNEVDSQLDAEIQSALADLTNHEKTSKEYATIVEHVSTLYKLKADRKPKPLSPDAMIAVAANLFGILWLTRHEQEHPITSKALGFVIRPRW